MIPRLGVNIDHVATIRNARGSAYPDPVRAALLAVKAGADGITAHLREDRRHISDADIERLTRELPIPLNLEMAATEEMLAIALAAKPHAACIVPEKREERTTEGGLDAAGQHNHLAHYVRELNQNGSRVSLFVEATREQMDAARSLGAPVVELHTGAYAEHCFAGEQQQAEAVLQNLREAARYGASLGLEIHAGHGLTFETVAAVAAIPQIAELNIGHFLVSEAIFCGLDVVIYRMKELIVQSRAGGAA
ncbi:Pyridoxine 5'-phosphate synthase [hydrothermal vent metagenome]|uniref:Pyridoxine 5'-phosphate synthase n=1 Tax=hydrothermal vent metagenome TaxID=652676 RepID=A0A3B0S004_9ZZZZ